MPLIDVAVVTALAEEFQTVREVFAREMVVCGTDRRGHIDADLYRLDDYTICLASGFGMGGVKMAAFAADVFAKWKPVSAILTGIAGVVKRDWFDLGDVAVAEQVFGYGNVAVLKDKLVFRKAGYQSNSALRRAANMFRSTVYSDWQENRRAYVVDLAARVSETRPLTKKIKVPSLDGGPQVFVEAGASGPFLVRDAYFRDETVGAGVDANVAWLEMEGDGFMESAHAADVKAIVIKGISDPSDENKPLIESETNGFFRLYAAANAASVAVETLKRSTLVPVAANRFVYDLTLSPRLPWDRGVAIAVEGAHNVGFPHLLLSQGSIAGARLTVRAFNEQNVIVPPAKAWATLEVGPSGGTTLQHSTELGEVAIPIGDCEQPAAVSYAAGYREPVVRLEATVTALFHEPTHVTWKRVSEGDGS